ncbi:cation transporting ATPase C-terminal domain-containing protein [Streptomyces sp. NPDC002131]|uniref:cation transporting ATPase C-terminal domain-containing protein n=1 Tax=Streptomyces sp. NPDC002131 TaxID=3154535 RepID=UPI0033318B62
MSLGLRERLFTRRNLYLPAAVAVAAGLGMAAVYVPFLADLLETSRPTGTGLALAMAAGLVGFAAARAEALWSRTHRPNRRPSV